MKSTTLTNLCCLLIVLFGFSAIAQNDEPIRIVKSWEPGIEKPIPVSLEGFSGEVLEVLRFDLFVQGFSFVSPDAAQYLISGSNAGNVQGRVIDRFSKNSLLARSYTGALLRREAHAFADDIVFAIRQREGHCPHQNCVQGGTARRQRRNLRRRLRRPQSAGRHPRRRDCGRARVGARPARAVLHVLQTRQPGHFLSRPDHRPAPRYRALFRLEHQRRRLAGRHPGGNDFEQGRQPERLCMQQPTARI